MSLLPHLLFFFINLDSRYLFYTLVYNPILLFCCSNGSSFGHWESLSWLLCTLDIPPLLWIFFFSTSLLSALTRCYSSLCIFLAPSSRISHFSKKPCVYTILSHEKLHSRSQPWILIIPFLSSYPTLS